MQMKKTLCLMLCLTMLVGMLAGCGVQKTDLEAVPEIASTVPSESPKELDMELVSAVDVGLIEKITYEDSQKQCSYRDFCALIDRYFMLAAPQYLTAWQRSSAKYHDAPDKMTNLEGILLLFQAAQDAQIDSIGYQYNLPVENFVPAGVNFWNGAKDYPLIGDVDSPSYYDETIANSNYAWMLENPYLNNAVWFASRFSDGNGKTYFPYDENYTYSFGEELIQETAVRAVKRLYDTTVFNSYVPAEEIICGVTPEAIQAGSQLPEAAYNALPDWKGYCMSSASYRHFGGIGKRYTEEEIKVIADLGFNMVRVQIDFKTIFPNGDVSRACPEMMANLDELINLCAKYGLHVCIDMAEMEGYTFNDNVPDNLFTDKTVQARFAESWRFMAEHYRDVPSNLLSFLLLNEPHDEDESAINDENYGAVMRLAIDAIRESTPDRLVIVSALGAIFPDPPESLADAQVAIGCSAYILDDNCAQWPLSFIPKNHDQGGGDLVIKGSLPAGTQVRFTVAQYTAADLTLYADGVSVLEFSVDGQIYDGTGLKVMSGEPDIQWTGTNGGLFGTYTLTVSLEKACGELRLKEKKDGYYEIQNFNVITPDTTYSLAGAQHFELKWNRNPEYLLSQGTVVAENGAALVLRDQEELESMLQPYLEYRQRTGAEYLVLEFGFDATTIPNDVAVRAAKDWLDVLERNNIGWIAWVEGFGPVYNHAFEEMNVMIADPESNVTTWLRPGAVYKQISENFTIETELMQVYQSFMQK